MSGIFDLSDPEDRARSRELDAYLNANSEMDDAEEKAFNADKVEAMSELLDDSSALEINSIIAENTDFAALATTLKAMLVSYHYSFESYLASDRERSKKDFKLFSKSFMNVCLGALEEHLEKA